MTNMINQKVSKRRSTCESKKKSGAERVTVLHGHWTKCMGCLGKKYPKGIKSYLLLSEIYTSQKKFKEAADLLLNAKDLDKKNSSD